MRWVHPRSSCFQVIVGVQDPCRLTSRGCKHANISSNGHGGWIATAPQLLFSGGVAMSCPTSALTKVKVPLPRLMLGRRFKSWDRRVIAGFSGPALRFVFRLEEVHFLLELYEEGEPHGSLEEILVLKIHMSGNMRGSSAFLCPTED